jgi:HK97 family phage major capsid protein
MNKEQLLQAMSAILAKAEAEGRAITAEEDAEFNRLKAQHDAIDANAERRAGLAALQQQASGARERIERLALAPDQALASLYTRPQGNTSRIGDLVKASLGMDGLSADQTRGGSSGFTVPTFLSAELIDAARAQARVIKAGARTIPVQGADVSFATVESDPAFASHGENQSINESEIVFGSRNFAPQTKVCLIRASVELVEDSPTFNNTVDSVLAAAYAVEIDRLAIVGSGVGEQWGVLTMDDIAEIDGSGLSTWAPFARAYQAVRTANHTPGAFITSPGGMGAIDGLMDTHHQPLNPPPSLRNTAFLDTTSIPVGDSPVGTQAVTGEWPLLFLAVRGNGLTIEATRQGGDAFTKLSVLIRAYARIDSFVVRRAAFAKVTGIPVPAIG